MNFVIVSSVGIKKVNCIIKMQSFAIYDEICLISKQTSLLDDEKLDTEYKKKLTKHRA